MKNATKFDVKCAVHGWQGDLSKVMFGVTHPWYGWVLAHIKDHIEINNRYMVAMETHNGCPILAEYDWLRAIPRKQGSQPKVKRKPQKGSKPWLAKFEYVDYDPKMIKEGTKVLCRDKKIRVVVGIEPFIWPQPFIRLDSGQDVWLSNGKESTISNCEVFYDIMKILVEKNVEKPKSDPYNGYAPNVWHFWQGLTEKPPVDGHMKVQIWFRGDTLIAAEGNPALFSNDYWWKWLNNDYDIIAFRIVGWKTISKEDVKNKSVSQVLANTRLAGLPVSDILISTLNNYWMDGMAVTAEDIAQEYTLSKYGQMSDLYNGMCAEIALLRNLAYDAVKGEPSSPAMLDTLPELEHKKTVFVKVRGKKNYEQHEYVSTVAEDNLTIINNVKKQMKEDGVIADVVFVAEKM